MFTYDNMTLFVSFSFFLIKVDSSYNAIFLIDIYYQVIITQIQLKRFLTITMS